MPRFLPTNQIWRYWSFERFLDDVAALGLKSVDLWLCNQHVNIDAHGLYNVEEVVSACKKRGIDVRTLTPEQSNPKAYNIASLDGQIKRLTKGYYEQVIRLAGLLGARRISINGGWRLFDENPARSWDALCSMLRWMCRSAAGEGIEVCLEPLTKTRYRLVFDVEGLSRALKEVNEANLRVTLDTGTIARNGDELAAYLQALGGDIGYVHLTNLDPGVFAHLGWGDPQGVLDPHEILRQLAARGYEEDCALEMTKSAYHECPCEILARSINTLKGCER